MMMRTSPFLLPLQSSTFPIRPSSAGGWLRYPVRSRNSIFIFSSSFPFACGPLAGFRRRLFPCFFFCSFCFPAFFPFPKLHLYFQQSVAKLNRALEVQVFRGFLHFRLQVDCKRVELSLVKPRPFLFLFLLDSELRCCDCLPDCGGGDAVLLVEFLLDGAAPAGFPYCAVYCFCPLVAVEDDSALKVARCPAHGLYERGFIPQEALLVSVQYCHQGYFGYVQPFAQEVDAN